MADWPHGIEKRVFATLDSTMDEAARIRGEVSHPVWLLALEQSAARGRRGRIWRHPPGNFAATLIYRPGGRVEDRALRSYVAALALRDALVQATGRAEAFRLKWPNDVLLNGCKLAGILLESHGDTLAIGIGVNLSTAPDSAEIEAGAVPPVSLSGELGLAIAPEAFLDLLAPAFAAREAELVTYGFDPVRRAWLDNAARLGQIISARTARDEKTGTFETIDDQGMLVLKAAGATHRIPAADIFFPAAS